MNARDAIDDFFPIDEAEVDDFAEKEAVEAQVEQTVSAPPESELPRAWRIIFDNDGEEGVDYAKGTSFTAGGTESSPISRASSTRIELFDRSYAAAEDDSPSSEGDAGYSPDLASSSSFAAPIAPDILDSDVELEYREVVVDRNGLPRQAGAESTEGEFIKRFRARAEQNLFVFLKGVLGRFFLTAHFHQRICEFLQQIPPYRKLVLMPREHAKTAIVSGGLPLHILVQPAESNIYFPGLEGSECRILLAGETERMAKKNLRVLKSIMEENKVFRAFWPHRCWGDGEQKQREWTSESIIIPRANEWPDPTIKAVGVGGAITGARPNVMIKDDLVSFKAMNSDVVMNEAIEWHIASRALLDTYEVESGLQSLEFIVGTRWAVFDLYSYIIDNDPSVAVNSAEFHRIINNGKILWPEKYAPGDIEQLRLEHGSMFYLLYLNSAADPSLTDFDCENVREFAIVDGRIVFSGEARDTWLSERQGKLGDAAADSGRQTKPVIDRGMPLSLLRLQENLRGGVGCRIRA